MRGSDDALPTLENMSGILVIFYCYGSLYISFSWYVFNRIRVRFVHFFPCIFVINLQVAFIVRMRQFINLAKRRTLLKSDEVAVSLTFVFPLLVLIIFSIARKYSDNRVKYCKIL